MLLQDGTGLEAIGIVSGIRTRAISLKLGKESREIQK